MGSTGTPDNIQEQVRETQQEDIPLLGFINVTAGVQNDVSSALIGQELDENIELCNEKMIRMILLRHYPYDGPESARKIYDSLEKIPEKERHSLKILLDSIFSHPNRTLLVYDKENGNDRNRITAVDLARVYGIPDDQIMGDVFLGAIDSTLPLIEKLYISHGQLIETIRKISQRSLREIDNIVIIGNRSKTRAFDAFGENRTNSPDDSVNQFEKRGFAFYDVDHKLRRIPFRANSLQITNEEYHIFQSLFPEFGDIGCISLQSHIQNKFNLDKTLFEKYLYSASEDLRVFCLANLLIVPTTENIQSVKQCLHGFRTAGRPISLEMLNVFLKEGKDASLVKEALLMNMLLAGKKKNGEIDTQREEITLLTIRNLCNEANNGSIYNEIHTLVEIIKSSDSIASNIFGKSLDVLVQGKHLLSRTLYSYRRKSEEEIIKLREKKQGNFSKGDEYTGIIIGLESLLDINSPLPHILIGHVGEGKSTELTRIKDEIDTNPAYINCITLFYSTKIHYKGNIIENIKDNINTLRRHFPEKKIVVFFDGIDELSEEICKDIIKGLKVIHSSGVRVILSSRPLGFDKYENVYFQTIFFGKINIRDRFDFIKSRLENLGIGKDNIESKFNEIEDFLDKSTLNNELKETPLILFFLTRLCVIGKLEKIHNRAGLYGEITKLLLIEHQKKKDINYKEYWDINILLNTLSYCAFQMHKNKSINREDILMHLKREINKSIGFDDENEVIENMANQVFLLYQIEGGKYQFILKSFEEYFLARYLFLTNKEVMPGFTYQEGDCKISIGINTLRLYAEMLINNDDIERLLKLFSVDENLFERGGIHKEEFFIGLEMLLLAYEKNEYTEDSDLYLLLRRYKKSFFLNDYDSVRKEIGKICAITQVLNFRANPVLDGIIFDSVQILQALIPETDPYSASDFKRNEYINAVFEFCRILTWIGTTESINAAMTKMDILIEFLPEHKLQRIYTQIKQRTQPRNRSMPLMQSDQPMGKIGNLGKLLKQRMMENMEKNRSKKSEELEKIKIEEKRVMERKTKNIISVIPKNREGVNRSIINALLQFIDIQPWRYSLREAYRKSFFQKTRVFDKTKVKKRDIRRY